MANKDETSILKSSRVKIAYTGIIIGFVFVCFSAYIGNNYMGETKAQRLLHLKQSVQIARNAIEPILTDVRTQKISKAAALTQIQSLIRKMVYDDHIGKNYIFMSSYDGIMLVQPFEPEKEMTYVWDIKDYYGVYIVRDLVKAARSKAGQGYVSYYYQRPGQKVAQEKISFVMGIPELGCYIGTGQYMGDLRKCQTAFIIKIVCLTLVLLTLLFFLVRASMKELHTQNTMLKKAERQLAAIFHNTYQFIGTLSVDGKLTKINRSALDFIEQDEMSVIGKPYWDTPWWMEDDAKARLKTAIHNCAEGEFSRFEATFTRPNRNKHFIDFSLTPIFDEKENVTFLLAEGRDMTEQVNAKNDLIREKNFSENLIKSLPGLFFLYKQHGKRFLLTQWNRQHETLLGFTADELDHADITTFFQKQDLPDLNNALTKLQVKIHGSVELNVMDKDGHLIPVLFIARSFKQSEETFIIGTGIELTEQKQAEAEKEKLEAMLHQSQKMEAIGTLAGGIAHDFNNILGAILGYAELVKTKLSPDHPARGMQNQIINASIRAKDLVQQILLFSRQSKQEMRPLQPDVVIKEAIDLLRSTIPATIEIKQEIPQGLGAILADSTQIHQIIMNLCTNAYHAMREKGGVIGICLSEKTILNDDYLFSELTLTPGNYLFLEISDTGHGMDKATLEKVFDPYFTTKKTGEGTGLGLSVVHGIVKNCGGELKIYSEPGRGTTVHIYFPKLKTEDHNPADLGETKLQTGTERLLLVDDDPAILDMLKQSIETLGYQVIAFQSSRKALDEFRNAQTNYDMVITDMTMPEMTGFELSKQILKQDPGMPIVLCTGYSELITKEKAEAIGIKGFIMKPVPLGVLAGTIREVLDS
nr:cache domain-containing protein [uncultured Desulfobacter sp.]